MGARVSSPARRRRRRQSFVDRFSRTRPAAKGRVWSHDDWVDGKPLVNRLSFDCLGHSQEQDATTTQATRVRLAKGRARFNQMHPIWVDTGLSTASKIAVS